MRFGEKIRKHLDALGKSQKDLAKAIGTTQQIISNWVNNKAEPSSRFIVPAARYLGVSADYLLDDEQEVPPREFGEMDRVFLEAVRELGYDKAMKILLRAIPPETAGQLPQPTPLRIGSLRSQGSLNKLDSHNEGPESVKTPK